MSDGKLLSRSAAARLIGLSPAGLLQIERAGGLHPVTPPGMRRKYFREDEVRALAQEAPTAEEPRGYGGMRRIVV